jgi:hypothetical protein
MTKLYDIVFIILLCLWGQTDTAVVELGCLVGSHRDEHNHLRKRLSLLRSFTVARWKETILFFILVRFWLD